MTYGRQEPGEPYTRISISDAKAMQDSGALVIDVRRLDEWMSGHVSGAIHIPVDDILGVAENRLPKNQDLLFICALGVRSGLACEMVSALGFETTRLYNIEDGTPAWIEQGRPTEYGA
jgi:rhodanese-related sulfurtransferase